MLMIQKMRCYADDWQEINRLYGIIRLLLGPGPSGRWCLMGLLENGIWHACLVELSSESVMKSNLIVWITVL
jgi:hypothetical protein